MKFNEYQDLASRTANATAKGDLYELSNFGLGISGESGEVADIIKKAVFHGHDISIKELEKELGDVLWYLSQIARVNDLYLENIAIANIEKLKKRYPNGFSESDSINRVE